ncbi:hypothetical protein [Erwinia phyllosphaerae]|uniref:hypothetical protein n=1 Tax=Erwinia phyllosphaerae TaxID=2853256 RepID=UPI001FEEC4B4|nr:hypothetical protein [Erwinia phyllosphaerae]MBV4366256.1 hypothetical protein [Erwinia phyllosphaerae]
MGTLVSWTPDNGGYYPVLCNRCNRVIGSVDTLLNRADAIKIMDAMHYCSAKVVLITDRNKLAEAQAAAKSGNFELGNKLLREAYSY